MSLYYGFTLNALEHTDGTAEGQLEIWKICPEEGSSTSYRESFDFDAAPEAGDAREWVKQMLVMLVESL